MARKLIIKWLNTFSSCLLYTCETVLKHDGSGKKTTSSAWSMQPLRPLNSTDPETIPFGQRLGRRIFASVSPVMQPSTVQFPRMSGSANVWPWPVQYSIFHCDEGIALHSFQQPCRTVYTIRIHIQGEKLHEAQPVFPCTVVYLRRCGLDSINVCHCDRWLRPRAVCQYTDASLSSSVYQHILNRRFAGFSECRRWRKIVALMNIYPSVMFWSVCILACSVFSICWDVT